MSMLLVFCLVFSSSIALAADIDTNNKLTKEKIKKIEELDKITKLNLKEAKEQLKQQGMLSHYDIHKKLIEEDYEEAKKFILDADDLSVMTLISYHFPNGGQQRAETKIGYTGTITEEYYTKAQLRIILDNWVGTNGYTLGGLRNLVLASIAAYKIPNIGPIIAGFSIFMYVTNFITYNTLVDLHNYGYGMNRSVNLADGSSSIWLRWTTYPYSGSISTNEWKNIQGTLF